MRVVGSLKFDAAQPDPRPGLDVPALLRQIGVKHNAKILVAGSTHAGEEAILAEMLQAVARAVSRTCFSCWCRAISSGPPKSCQELESRGGPFHPPLAISPPRRMSRRASWNAFWSTAPAN